VSAGRLTVPVTEADHSAGPDDAPITLVEYGDYQCPSCGMAYPIVQAVQKALGDNLRFVFRNFPLTEAHAHAEHAAEMAEAAGVQGKFWEMHDMLFEHQGALDDQDLVSYAEDLGLDTARAAEELEAGAYTDRIRKDFRGGIRSGVNGTPTFFVNGMRYDGNWTDEEQFTEDLSLVLSG
jgi:protein-disulfide isomerase